VNNMNMEKLRGTSNGVLVALFIIGLIIGIGIGFATHHGGGTKTVTITKTVAANSASSVTAGTKTVTITKTITATKAMMASCKHCGLRGKIPIGILLPETGGLASDGRDNIKAAKLAIEDFDKFLESIGAPFRFVPIVADSGTNPRKALAALEAMYNEYHVQVVVGTDSSWVLSGVMGFANTHHIVMISPASTSPALAKPDYIFRVVGNDLGQGKALATLIHSKGYNTVVVIFRNEAYGRGLADAFKHDFEKMYGGKVVFIPYNPEQSDFAPQVEKLASVVKKLLSEGKKVAVLLIAFDTDGINILTHASQIPVLSKVQWFTSDALTSPALLKAPKPVREFLLKVHMEGTFPVPAKSPLYAWFVKHFEQVYGRPPQSAYSPYAYDAAYLACLSVVVAGQYNGKVIKEVLPIVAEHFFGVTGWKLLDKNGDLKYQKYSIWVYACNGGKCEFKTIAMYNPTTGKITPVH